MNVSVEIGEVNSVYKELRLFSVGFRNRSAAVLALDTVTGEYGVAPPDVAEMFSDRGIGALSQEEGV